MADPAIRLSGDTSRDLQQLAKALRDVDPLMRKQLPARLREAAKPIRDDANSRKPSSKIRVGTRVKLNSRNGASVTVVASSPKNPPLAGLLEAGNKGRRNAATFRHPVFGNRDVWVEQPTKPYLRPAGQAHAEEARQRIEQIVDDIAKHLGAR